MKDDRKFLDSGWSTSWPHRPLILTWLNSEVPLVVGVGRKRTVKDKGSASIGRPYLNPNDMTNPKNLADYLDWQIVLWSFFSNYEVSTQSYPLHFDWYFLKGTRVRALGNPIPRHGPSAANGWLRRVSCIVLPTHYQWYPRTRPWNRGLLVVHHPKWCDSHSKKNGPGISTTTANLLLSGLWRMSSINFSKSGGILSMVK